MRKQNATQHASLVFLVKGVTFHNNWTAELSKPEALMSDTWPRIILDMLGPIDALQQDKQSFQICNLAQVAYPGIILHQ